MISESLIQPFRHAFAHLEHSKTMIPTAKHLNVWLAVKIVLNVKEKKIINA